MNSRQLTLPLRGCPYFIGVYGADDLKGLLPKIRNIRTRPLLFIVNVHVSSNRTMGHWVTFYASSSTLAFLDSFALPMETYGKHFTYFKTQLQHLTFLHLPYRVQSLQSLTCGAYAIYFVSSICKYGLRGGLERFFHLFHPSRYTANDTIALSYAYKFLTPMPPCIRTFGRNDCKRLQQRKKKVCNSFDDIFSSLQYIFIYIYIYLFFFSLSLSP